MTKFDQYGQIIPDMIEPDKQIPLPSIHLDVTTIPTIPTYIPSRPNNEKTTPRRSSLPIVLLVCAGVLLCVAGLVFSRMGGGSDANIANNNSAGNDNGNLSENPPQEPTSTMTQNFATNSPTREAVPVTEVNFESQVQQGLEAYNITRNEALRTSDKSLIRRVTTGKQLDKELNTIQLDLETGAHHEIYIHEMNVIGQIEMRGDREAYIVINKTEDRLFYPAGCSVPDDTTPCSRPSSKQNTARNERYRVRYHMVFEDNTWKVDSATVQN